MIASQKKLLIGGAAVIGLIALISKKSSSVEDDEKEGSPIGSPPNENGCAPGSTTFNGICVPVGKSQEGQPAGPSGCAPGLVVKNGICVKPESKPAPQPDKEPPFNGLGSASDLYISPDCKTVKFGDKTGAAWWKNKGKTVAKEWLDMGFENPLLISFSMLQKVNSACLKSFPTQIDSGTRISLENKRINWIKANRPLWNLIWSIRNQIDMDFLGDTVSPIIDPKTGVIDYGKNFSIGAFWPLFKPMAAAILLRDEGKEFEDTVWAGIVPKGTFSQYEFLEAISAFIMFVIFSNLSVNQFLALWTSKTVFTNSNELFKYIFQAVGGMWQDDSYKGEFPLEA